MHKPLALFFTLCLLYNIKGYTQFKSQEIATWNSFAKKVEIIRDNYGVPHIYGKTDAAAVFGLMYAQCEDDFPRVERNYIEKLGRLSEIKGESFLYQDLYVRMIIDSAGAINDYNNSPSWLKDLLDAYAAGINFYLLKHPHVKPELLQRFEPWYPLLWTDGSIGAISTGGLTAAHLKNYYAGKDIAFEKSAPSEEVQTGSNGFAISGMNSASGNALLYINPHVDFYFRPEVHVVSEQGLNVYGAVTWGQFFVYQGFNESNGWMHTSSEVDVSDLYSETIVDKENGKFYKYENELKPVIRKEIVVRYKTTQGLKSKTFPAFYTHHGPVMSSSNGKLIAVKSNNRSMNGLIQSWKRTKARDFEDYKSIMNLRSNTSNNTVYAGKKGIIAYWHGNFIPVRDKKYNWAKPVEGSLKETEWKGLHSLDETIFIYNPPGGWIQNCNSTPFTAAGKSSPGRLDFPVYMAPDAENYRGINAVRILSSLKKPTLDDLIKAGYDRKLSAFEKLIPALLLAFEKQGTRPPFNVLSPVIDSLRTWDMSADAGSVAAHVAIEWGGLLLPKMIKSRDKDEYPYIDHDKRTDRFLSEANPEDLLNELLLVIKNLEKDWGTWMVPWGEVNRYQRISEKIELIHSDSLPGLAVPFASSAWGMLPSYASAKFPGTKKRYGIHGNSFVAAVEFGTRIKAKSLLAGGQSGHADSPHFTDQAEMYVKGVFKDVLFYKEDVMKHAIKIYHPGSD